MHGNAGFAAADLDLNLLPILEALLRTRSVTRAARELNMSQSAASHALSRLRRSLDDPLLVPANGGMEPTRRALRLEPILRDALERVRRAVEDRPTFDPRSVRRPFHIATADYIAALIGPRLVRGIERVAPGASVQFAWSAPSRSTELRRLEIDLIVMPEGTIPGKQFRSDVLFVDRLVVIAARDHPDIGDALDLETYMMLPHVAFGRPGEAESVASSQERRRKMHVFRRAVVADFLLLPLMVAGTRCIALTHESLARHVQSMVPIRLLEPPFPTEPVPILGYWAAALDDEPEHVWLRSMLRTACDEIGAPLASSRRKPRGDVPQKRLKTRER